MDPELPHQIAGPAEVKSIVAFHEVSKWYGNVIGLNKLTIQVPTGVTGLLGPNGAGKSTFLQLATGQLYPSQGTVRVLGRIVWNNPVAEPVHRPVPRAGRLLRMDERLGFRLHFGAVERALPRRRPRRDGADPRSGRHDEDRKTGAIGGYSKGMRQRIKLAQALVHDPEMLFLDEPLTGTDPVARRDLMDIIQRLGGAGQERAGFQPRAA